MKGQISGTDNFVYLKDEDFSSSITQEDKSENSDDYNTPAGTESPKVSLNSNEQLLQTISKNLDLDDYDEQIIVVRMIDTLNMPIKLVILDYDSILEKYVRSWEFLTTATNRKAYNIELEDVIGDFNYEVVFTGMNNNGETILDVFKKIPSPPNVGLFFSPICQLMSDGTIKIEKSSRSSTYLMRQKTGKSFPIILEKQDKESQNNMDLIREEYDWDYIEGDYILVSSKSVPATEVEQNQLRELYYSTELKDFDNFLSGSWYNKQDINKIIFFAPEEEKLIFYSEDLQEIYYWKYRTKTIYNGLLFIVQNPTSNDIRKNLNISIKSMDSIIIAFSNIEWDGTYKKVTSEFEESLFNKKNYLITPAAIHLSDFYEDENEEIKIIFEAPRFTYLSPSENFEGGFSVIKNIPILNNFYLKRKLRKIPTSLTKNTFEKEILGVVTSLSAKQTLKIYYKFDRKRQEYILPIEELTNKELIDLWDIFLSINYKGYKDYQIAVLTLKILDRNNISKGVKNYIIEYAEVEEDNRTVNTIVMTPGELGVKGIEATTTDSITLTQTVYKD